MKLLLYILPFVLTITCAAQWHRDIKEVLVEAEADKSALENQKEAGASKIVISSKDLNNLGHQTAGDVLKRLPLIVTQGPPSFNRNIMMAGLDKQFQATLINGERPAGGEDYRDLKLDRIPIDMIETIEIIFNPPATLGADATIGAVNITLKESPDKKIVSADLSMDYTSTHSGINPELALMLGNKWGKWSALGTYSLNSFKRTNINTLTDGELSGTETEDLNVWIHGLLANFAYKPDSTKTITYQPFFSYYAEELDFLADIKRRTQGGLNSTADTANDDKIRILQTHTLTYTLKKNSFLSNSWLQFAQNIDSKDRWRWREQDAGTEESYEDEYQVNNEILAKSELSKLFSNPSIKQNILAGVRLSALDRDYDRLVYTKTMGHLFWDNIEDGSYTLNEYRSSAYLSDEITLKNWWLLPAIRLDIDWGNYTTATESGTIQYQSVNPSLHAKYSLKPNFFLKADVAQQISRPPFNLMVPVDKVKNKKETIERGNPELVPSTAYNFGLGAEKYLGDKSVVALRGFYSILRDVIETREIGIDETYGYRIFQSVNVDSGLVWGIDVNTRMDLEYISLKHVTLNANVSWLGSEVRDPGTSLLRRLNEQPKWICNASVDYLNTRYGFQISVGGNYIGERVTSATVNEGSSVDALIQKPFFQMDARVKYYFTNWGSVYVNFINVFDETVELSQGNVAESEIIGRNIIAGISLHF